MFEFLNSMMLIQFHDDCLDPDNLQPNTPIYALDDIRHWISANHQFNCIRWDEKNQIKCQKLSRESLIGSLNEIDYYNQERNQAIARIDELFLRQLKWVEQPTEAQLCSETVGEIVDRLSILSLKIQHLRLQIERADLSQTCLDEYSAELGCAIEQRRDIGECLDRLLQEIREGKAFFKLYHRFGSKHRPCPVSTDNAKTLKLRGFDAAPTLTTNTPWLFSEVGLKETRRTQCY